MGKLLKGGILGGLVLFIWGAISWTVLDWHISTLEKFPDENAATAFIEELPESGMYMLPLSFKLSGSASQTTIDEAIASSMKRKETGPIVLASVWKGGTDANMIQQLVVALITQIIAAIIVTGLVLIKPHTQFSGRFFQVILFALAAAIVTYIPYMNWFFFPTYYTIISILDLLIGWFFAAFVISHFTRPKYPNFY